MRCHQSAPWRLVIMIGCSAACGSTEPGQTGGGGLSVVTTTTGIQPDSDGYIVLVDGVRYKAVGANDSVMVHGIPPGSHTVELFGIAFNCATVGEFARTVSVSAEAETPIAYSVTCDTVSRSRIAFVRLGTVAIMNADGSEIRNLFDSLGAVSTEVLGVIAVPFNWSGDGSRVAFTRADGRCTRRRQTVTVSFSWRPPAPRQSGRKMGKRSPSSSTSPPLIRSSVAMSMSLSPEATGRRSPASRISRTRTA